MPQTPPLPPVLYLPCAEHVADPAAARPLLRRTRDGRLALLVHTALDRLHRCCGDEQPWVLIRTDRLAELRRTEPFDLLLPDVVIPAAHRHAEVGGPA